MNPYRAALARLEEAAADGRLGALCARHRVAVLGAFGSVTRDDPDPRDLDLAFAFVPDEGRDFIALLADLVELAGVERVDLVDLDRAHPVAASHAVVGVPLYEYADGAFAASQVAALTRRMDTEWLRDLELELLAS